MMYQPITYSLLKSKKACQNQLDRIETHFGKIKPIPLTIKIAIRFCVLFDINWAARNLLTKEDLAEYLKVTKPAKEKYFKVKETAWEEYEKVTKPAEEEYKKVKETAWEEYEKVSKPAWEEYEKVTKPSFVEYNKVTKPSLEEYNKSIALTFIKLYTKNMK